MLTSSLRVFAGKLLSLADVMENSPRLYPHRSSDLPVAKTSRQMLHDAPFLIRQSVMMCSP
jgi:hypothetical protein